MRLTMEATPAGVKAHTGGVQSRTDGFVPATGQSASGFGRRSRLHGVRPRKNPSAATARCRRSLQDFFWDQRRGTSTPPTVVKPRDG